MNVVVNSLTIPNQSKAYSQVRKPNELNKHTKEKNRDTKSSSNGVTAEPSTQSSKSLAMWAKILIEYGFEVNVQINEMSRQICFKSVG